MRLNRLHQSVKAGDANRLYDDVREIGIMIDFYV